MSILAVCGFIALLAVLATLQYRWLAQVSEADAEKMQRRLDSDTERFAADFNREIQGAYFNFQIGPAGWKSGDPAEFNQRYEFWRSNTEYPTLIKQIVFIENKPGAVPLLYNAESRTFEPSELPNVFEELRARSANVQTFQTVYDEVPALVTPIYDRMHVPGQIMLRKPGTPPKREIPPKYGFLVILLDESTLKDQILSDLARKYFPDGDYHVAVRAQDEREIFRTENGTDGSNSSAKLFELSPDKFVFSFNRETPPASGERKREVFVSQRVERGGATTEVKTGENGEILEVNNRGPIHRTTVIERANMNESAPWQLSVQHRDGSVENFVAGVQRRNLTVGFGLLAVLATGILLVFVSAQRARSLAQRQLDFVSSVSHEFRTPLAVIYSAGENLADGIAKDENQVSRYGKMIKGEGKKLSGMVEQILGFAGSDSGRRKYNFRETDVAEVTKAALDRCLPMLKENDFEIETNIPTRLPPTVADGEALSGAIQNLLHNSAKYSNGKKWIRLSAEDVSGRIKISVEDRGIGVSKEDLRQIFQPFFRSKTVVDAQIHGSGLGLSLVKQIAEAHGGKVYAESEVGKGSKFTIDLAAAKP